MKNINCATYIVTSLLLKMSSVNTNVHTRTRAHWLYTDVEVCMFVIKGCDRT